MKNINTFLSIRLMGGAFVLAVLLGMGGRAQGQSIHVQYPDSIRYIHPDVPFDTINTPFWGRAYNIGEWNLCHRFFTVFHCDAPVEIAGVGFSGPLNENRHKDAKAWVYLLGFSQSGNGEMVILDSSLYNAEKEPVIIEYPFLRQSINLVNLDTAPCLPVWEMLFSNTHIVSDSFAVAVDDPDVEWDAHDSYIDHLRYGNVYVDIAANIPLGLDSSMVLAQRDYSFNDEYAQCLPNYPGHRTLTDVFDSTLVWALTHYNSDYYHHAHEGAFFPIRATDCPKVGGVRIDSVAATQTWLSWPSCDSAASYRVEYMLQGGHFGDGQWVTGITDTFCCIQNLQPGRAYDFYVQAFCPRQQQYGLPSYPTTALLGDVVTCPDVEGLRIAWQNRDLGVLTLAFDSLDEHLRYQIAVCPYDCEDPELGRIYDVDENPYYIYDLDTNTYYAAYVRAQCSHECLVHHDSLFWGGWGDPIYFYAGRNNPLGITTAEAASFTVTPNPASSRVTVTSAFDILRITFYDMQGHAVLDTEAEGLTAAIDVQELPAGSYVVGILTRQGLSTRKVVIER